MLLIKQKLENLSQALQQLRKRIDAEYLVLFCSLGIIILASYGVNFYKEPRFWAFFIFTLGLYFLIKLKKVRDHIIVPLSGIISSRDYVFGLSLGCLLYSFLNRFPLKDWPGYVLYCDYPVVFAQSRVGFDILSQGGLFGWNPSFVGGYFTAAETGLNIIHFLLPLSFLGWEVGFHLLLLLSFLSFPILCFYYIKVCLKIESKEALIILPVAAIFVLTYFNGALHWGMVAAFLGVDLTILVLILLQRLKENKPHSFSMLLITLSLLFYTHLGMFSFSIMLILIDFIIEPDRNNLKYILLLSLFLFVVSLPLLIYKIKYSSYLNLDPLHYAPMEFPSPSVYLNQVKDNLYLLFLDVNRWRSSLLPANWIEVQYKYPIFLLPILIYLGFKMKCRKELVYILFLEFIFIATPQKLMHWLSRSEQLIPFFLTIIIGVFLIANYKKRNFVIFSLVLLLGLTLFLPVKLQFFKHGKPGDFYNRPLVDKIKTLDGCHVLIEHNAWFPGITRKVPSSFYWLPLLQLETKKAFFANMRGGYHFSAYRGNSLESGFFGGKPISGWAIEDVNKIIGRWGIRYLALWDETSKKYFSRYPDYYKEVWRDSEWIIFEQQNADLRCVVVEGRGSGAVLHENNFSKMIGLNGAEKGSRVIIRSNYFPAWKAYYNKKEIPLINFDGQIGFIAPASGNYAVELKYPRYVVLNMLAIGAIALSFIF